MLTILEKAGMKPGGNMADRKVTKVFYRSEGVEQSEVSGYYGVESMTYHDCQVDGDRHYVDIVYMDGYRSPKRIFDLIEVRFEMKD